MAVEVTLQADELDHALEALDVFEGGSIEAPVVDILHPEFILKETGHADLEALVIAAGLDPTASETEIEEGLASEKFTEFLAGCSRFATFQEMYKEAAGLFLLRRIQRA